METILPPLKVEQIPLTYVQLQKRVLELESELDRIDYLFQATNDAISVLDNNLFFKTINQSFYDFFSSVFGVQIQQNMNLSVALNSFSDYNQKLKQACDTAISQQTTVSVVIEHPNIHDKHYYCYEVLINALYNKFDSNYEFIFCIRNFTEIKLKDLLRHKQHIELTSVGRQSAMKEVASAIAHELNQPLAAIVTYSRACLIKWEEINKTDKLFHFIEQIAKQAEHAGEIVHGMKDLMYQEGFHVEETDINTIIQESLSILNYELLNFNLNIELNLLPERTPIMVNKTQIMQVILNLSRNSIEALKKALEPSPQLVISAQKIENDIIVNVCDNGPGVPDAFQDKLFRSYYTTKPRGVGLGLGICSSIIQAHGGTLIVKKHSGLGAWFKFTLPLTKRT